MERGIPHFICSGFSNYGKEFCERFAIKEQDLLDIINTHIWKIEREEGAKLNLTIENYVEMITVHNKAVTIYYTDGTSSFIDYNGYGRVYKA